MDTVCKFTGGCFDGDTLPCPEHINPDLPKQYIYCAAPSMPMIDPQASVYRYVETITTGAEQTIHYELHKIMSAPDAIQFCS